MLILCWNVAGLSTTVNRIKESYGSSSNNNSSKEKPSVVLAEYFERHGADIVCIQEHKIPLSQLSTRSEPMGCASIEPYESFWSCCIDKDKKGFNGVVTYVKKGMVLGADSSPLGSKDLDEQGRCVMTDHGTFVLFNVYVPASSGQPLSYKMKFLNALRRAMDRQRKKQKKVILVGDLNISHAKLDKFWSDRVLYVNDIRREVELAFNSSSLPTWKIQLANAWPKIEMALQTKHVVPTQTTNPRTNQKFKKYRMAVKVGEKTIHLGSHESDPRYCECSYDFESWMYVDAASGEEVLAEEENAVFLSVIIELMSKIAGVCWDEKTQRMIGNVAEASRTAPPRRWLNSVINEDQMVDAFRHFWPNAEGRYTCWHQFTNKRYTNEGARIDYTLVHKSLLPFVKKGDVESLRVCSHKGDPNSESAALVAAVANGGFQPVSFEGGGIVEARKSVLDTQFGTPHTGMIYTPPSFSDHIAVSLLLEDSCCANDLVLNQSDSATRKAQPHKAQKSIQSFFSAAKTQTTRPTDQTSVAGNKIPMKRNPQNRSGIQNFFVAKSISNSMAPAKRSKPNPKPKGKPSILNHFAPKDNK